MGDFAALKPCFLLAYGCLGLFYLSRAARLDFYSIAAALLILAGIALLTKFAYSADYLLIAAAAAGIVVTLPWQPRLVVLSAAVIALVLSLDFWWMDEPHRSFDTVQTYPLVKFAAVLALMLWAFSDRGIRRYPRWNLAASIIFVLAGLFVLGEHPEGHFNLLHWQAFSAPALDLNAGLVPFYDIPLQYGLGPSLIISTLCSEHACYPMLAFIVVCILANGVLLLQMALATSGGFYWRGAIFAAVFCGVFLWGTHGFAMLAFPSISGVRFLPVTLVAFLLFFGWPRAAAAALAGSMWWSPEAAAMSLVVFGLCEPARLGLLRAVALSAASVVGSGAVLTLAHRAVYGIWLDPLAWLEYIIHVPGEMPIDPVSSVLLLAAALGLGAFLLRSASYGGQGLRDYAVVGLLFATTVYYLGRSHPNNVNNLMPFIVLVAIRALDRPRSAITKLTALGLATSVALLAMQQWNWWPYDFTKALSLHELTSRYTTEEAPFEEIRARIPNPNHLGVANFSGNNQRDPTETVIWTPMDPMSTFYTIPPERRQLYIQRSATRLRRSGWGVFSPGLEYLPRDLQAGYTIAKTSTVELKGARYIVACFDPRPELAPLHVGPACP